MATIGDRIKKTREKLGWTQEKLAGESKISKGFLSDVENNKRDISSTNVLKIANAMGASLEYLLRGETENTYWEREPVQFPSTLSRAAMQNGWTYQETLTLLETHNSVVARRSNRSIQPPTEEEWKQLFDLINTCYPYDASTPQK
jgi:transcriptional regulator with XRE-family HTH domain